MAGAQTFDAIVIGAGPGGYVCGIRLGQLGVKTAIIEREFIGGICLNVGCIPSKALIHAGNFYEKLHHADELGISVEVKGLDLGKLKTWKDKVVKRLTGGVELLLKGNGVQIFKGTASFVNANTLEVKQGDGQVTQLTAKSIVISTGSKAFVIKGFEPDGNNVITSTEALDLTAVPKRLVVIGGGYIGLELGTYLAKVGSQVTVIEGTDKLLGMMDQDCVQVVARGLKRRNVNVVLQAKAKSYKQTSKGLEVTYETPQGTQTVECDKILVTVGRVPNTDGLALDRSGLKPNAKGFIDIDSMCRTKVPGIYAIGDVAGGALLAHKASREGIVCAEVIAGQNSAFDTTIIPAVVFTDPEIASVGLTLTDAQAKGFDAHEAQFPFGALGKALASGDSEGFAKIVADRKTHRLLGVHIVGADASALLGEAGLALEMGATLEDVAYTIHTHPTLPEALMEAAEVALGHPIHIMHKVRRAAGGEAAAAGARRASQ